MKILNLAILLLFSMGAVIAQDLSTSEQAPGVTVSGNKWRKENRPNLLDDGLLRDHERQIEYERDMKDTLYANTIRQKAGEPPLRLPTPPRTSPVTFDRNSTRYAYEVKFSNTGAKKIRKLVWEYVLLDRDTGRQLGHHEFTSEANIAPRMTKKLIGYSMSTPTSVVDAKNAGKEEPGNYLERVVVNRIEYDDGTFWERESK
jgi:hypothetical protein